MLCGSLSPSQIMLICVALSSSSTAISIPIMATAAATGASFFNSSNQIVSVSSRIAGTRFAAPPFRSSRHAVKRRIAKIHANTVAAPQAAAASVVEEIRECVLPTWAEYDLGRAPVYWKTMNGLPPTAGERLKLFYNPAATNLAPNEEFGIGFNGGFNQPIMCGGEPRAMLQKKRGKADPPIYTIQICIPKHATSLIFSFTNGTEWDGPYRLQFQVPRAWRNRPMEFFTAGLAEELSKEGACDEAIFPDSNIIATTCPMIGNLSIEGGDRCNLDLVLGCTDPNSPDFNPLANVDDGSCPLSDSEE